MATASLSLDNPVFRMFIGYAIVVVFKMFAVALLVSYNRVKNRVFNNEEDTRSFGGPKKCPLQTNHPTVERFRRIHQNDLENIVPFVIVGLLYVTTGPTMWAATIHFRLFTVLRLAYTAIYLLAIRQPTRFLCHLGCMGVTVSMAYHVLRQAAF